jgi:hypothetical protein
MTWQQPAALWLLLALLLLLFVRRLPPRQRLPVANLYLWSGLQARQTSAVSRRLRRHRLLIVQAAFLVCVVLALAGPRLAWWTSDAAVVIDVSMSMGARSGATTRLDAAKARAVSLVQALPFAARAHVYLAGPTVRPLGVFATTDAGLAQALQSVRASDASANLDAAVQHARSNTPPGAHLYVLSDAPPAADAPDVTWITFGEPVDNVALTTLAAHRGDEDGRVTLLVGAWNHAATPVATDAVVTQGAATLARQRLELPAFGGASIAVQLSGVSGVVTARLDAADGLAADNVRHAVIASPEPKRALLLGRSHYLEQALAALPGIEIGSPESMDASNTDLVICAGCQQTPRAYPDAGLLLLPPAGASSGSAAPLIVTADRHPIIDSMPATGGMVVPIGAADDIDETDVLARAGGAPAIVAYARDGRRVVEWRFDPERSGITAEPAFPMLVATSLAWLAPEPEAVDAGQPLLLHVAETVTRVVGPDGRDVVYRADGNAIAITDTDAAGAYRVATPTREISLVVNAVTASESDLSGRTTSGSLPKSGPPATAAGVSLTTMLLIAALATLALEWRMRRQVLEA